MARRPPPPDLTDEEFLARLGLRMAEFLHRPAATAAVVPGKEAAAERTPRP